jgi:uridine kinase
MNIIPTTPRNTVKAEIIEKTVHRGTFEGPKNTSVEEFIRAAYAEEPGGGRHVVAALVNLRLRELTEKLEIDCLLEPITTADSDGTRIYRRSLTFLLIAAAAELFPERTLNVQHSMPFGGYYCECVEGMLSIAELVRLRERMRALVAADLPIRQVQVPLQDALRIFRNNNDQEKADLFARRRKDYLTLYELNGVRDYFHGYMVPSTGYLDLFDLKPYAGGFILHFPRRHEPQRLQSFEDEPRLAQVFQDYSKWLRLLGLPSVAALNRAIGNGRIQELVLIAEALHEREVAHIANEIGRRHPVLRLVLISGPTSSGKTTFAKRLAIQLLAQGIRPVTLNMDNYFVNRENTPLDEAGEYNFEAFEAVDHALFNEHLAALLAGKQIIQPHFDFHTGQRSAGNPLRLGLHDLLLIEGIHALNPRLSQHLAAEMVYKITVSAFTQLNLDRHNRVPTTDTRLLRRIVRDAARRNHTAADTIKRWASVRRGEKEYIFPHQNEANIFFNSALFYESSVLKSFAMPLLLRVESGTRERIEANRLMAFLQWFDPLPETVRIPSNSILREFIGGSILESFEPWR